VVSKLGEEEIFYTVEWQDRKKGMFSVQVFDKQPKSRTVRCSSRRPLFRFLGFQRLSARPPLLSGVVRGVDDVTAPRKAGHCLALLSGVVVPDQG
jgi:hypothetical protein